MLMFDSGTKEARLYEQNGLVRIPKSFISQWPSHTMHAAVQSTPEGVYVACLSSLPDHRAFQDYHAHVRKHELIEGGYAEWHAHAIASVSRTLNPHPHPVFHQREIETKHNGDGFVSLADLCLEAGLSGDFPCIAKSYNPEWPAVAHVIELWSREALTLHQLNGPGYAPGSESRVLWTHREAQPRKQPEFMRLPDVA